MTMPGNGNRIRLIAMVHRLPENFVAAPDAGARWSRKDTRPQVAISWKQSVDLLRVTTRLVGLLCLGLMAYIAWLYLDLPPAHSPSESPPPIHARTDWPEIEVPPPDAWLALQGGAPAPLATAAAAPGRFRLVGTYFMMPPGADTNSVRKAVLDDVQKQTQILVEEGETIDGNQVTAIHRDRVVLTLPTGAELELLLRFGAGAGPTTMAEEDPAAPREPPWDEVTLATSRFGRQIADERWILSRDELLNYREELLDQPERLASLFVSMKPDRIDRKIEGYRLEREGEDEFWDAIGLQENDVIRRANSMKMTRQERAEYLISEFVSDRLNVVVLDIERDGEPTKLIYYLRK